MKRVHINAIVDALALVAFLALASTGLILRHQLPPGSGSAFGRGMGRGTQQRSIELLWGFTRHEWGDYHYWIALALLTVLSVHLFLHWKWIVCVVRGKQTDASGWRFALGLFALAVVTIVAVLPLITNTRVMTRQELQQQRSENTGQFPVPENQLGRVPR